jgi:hypothetical protein
MYLQYEDAMIGKEFEFLTVRKDSGKRYRGKIVYTCECRCGRFKDVISCNLRAGGSTSCGCKNRKALADRNWRHGLSRTAEYRLWAGMKTRGGNPNTKDAKNYVDRGIIVCQRWINSFVDFLADVGRRPSPKHTLERIDNDKGYEPGNVRWATNREQCRNKRNNRVVTIGDRSMCVTAWLEETGVKMSTFYYRVSRGMSPELALTLQPRKE